jgi:O-antigen/teichoic acid export membrane protein
LLYTMIFWYVMRTYGGDKYRYLLLILLTMFSSLFYRVFSYILVMFQKTAFLVKNTFYKDGSAIVLSMLLVIGGLSYLGLLSATIVTEIVAGLFIYFLIKRDLPYRMFIDRKILLAFLRISLPLLPVCIFTWVVQSSDSYFLVYYKGAESVGKYTIIYGLSSIVLTLNYILIMFWNPISARLWIENRDKYRETFISLFTAITAALFIIVLLFEFNSKIIMKILVRKADYQDAYIIMGMIALAFAMQVLITMLTAPLYSNRNPYTIFFSYFLGGLVNTLLNFFLIPPYGIIGAAISTVVSYFVIVLTLSFLNYRIARFSFFDKRLIYLGVAFLALWVGVAYLREHVRFYQLIISNVILLVILGSVVYFKVLKNEEKKFITSFFKGLSIKGTLEI